MGNLSSFLTTSFHTQLSFMDTDSDDNFLADEDEEDEDEEEEEESYATAGTES